MDLIPTTALRCFKDASDSLKLFPIPSMCGIFTYICLDFMINVDTHTIHGLSGFGSTKLSQ